MKIVSINPSPQLTNEKKVSFHTDPALSEEVFKVYSDLVGTGNRFRRDSGLLVADSPPPKEYLDHTAELLTEAEQEIEKRKARAIKQREEFLAQISKETGMPVKAGG